MAKGPRGGREGDDAGTTRQGRLGARRGGTPALAEAGGRRLQTAVAHCRIKPSNISSDPGLSHVTPTPRRVTRSHSESPQREATEEPRWRRQRRLRKAHARQASSAQASCGIRAHDLPPIEWVLCLECETIREDRRRPCEWQVTPRSSSSNSHPRTEWALGYLSSWPTLPFPRHR